MTGQTISRYQVLDKLGEGGMGVVWKARDTVLDRLVAIKLLPPDFGRDPSRLLRFEQEARAAASLNHSGIAAVYDAGEHDGVRYIVSEFVEGRTLRVLLGEGPLPHRNAVEIGAQLAEAIAVAHDAGIVHRDLKPENVMITREGRAKILDFGLARHMWSRAASQPAATVTLTQEHTVVGTPGYMSPEQVRGETSDHRSDIFSLGLILHEMLSGLRTFQRPTTAETMAAIVNDDPPPLPVSVGPGLAAIVTHCIEKEPGKRFQSAGDLAFALRSATGGSATLPVQPSLRPRRRFVLFGAALVAAALAGMLLRAWLFEQSEATTRHRYSPVVTVTHARDIAEGGGSGAHFPAWSPDAKSIAYSSDGVRLQRRDAFESMRLTTKGVHPFFSADGSRVYYLTSGQGSRELWSVSVAGGEPERVFGDLGGSELMQGAAMSRDGNSLALVRWQKPGEPMSVWVSSPPGADPRSYPGSPSGKALARGPLRFSPDGSKLLLMLAPIAGPAEWWILRWPPPASPDRAAARRIFEHGPRGITYFQSTADWLADSRHLIVALATEGDNGGPLWIADTLTESWRRITPEMFKCAGPRVSQDGRVLFHRVREQEHAVEIPLDGAPVRPLLSGLAKEQYPLWSPIGDHILFVTNQRGEPEIWVANRKEGWQRPVVTQRDFPPAPAQRPFVSPTLSPDGARVAYSSTDGAVWISPVAGGPPARICEGYAPTWSPDGVWLAFRNSVGLGNATSLMKVRVGRPQDVVTIRSAPAPFLARWSPDGKWITMQLPEGFGVISPDGLRTKVLYKGTLDIGSACGWSRDGSTLFLVSDAPGARSIGLRRRYGNRAAVARSRFDVLLVLRAL